jgi:alkylation response protein AidB-like acyl-CoA dehydrogenase
MSDDFPAFALSEEHQALREAVRALADDKIAPRAADVDRTSEFPWDVYEALVKADFQAVHIPEAYGGAGADAIATAIVIEEVARACASSSPRPRTSRPGTWRRSRAARRCSPTRCPSRRPARTRRP